MTTIRNVVQRGFLAPVLGLVCGLAASIMVGTRLIAGESDFAGDDEADALPKTGKAPQPGKAALVDKTTGAVPPGKTAPDASVTTTAMANTGPQTAMVEIKKSAEKPAVISSGSISVVRRASYIAFKGSEFQLFTGRYHCALDYFDTYYFNYLGDGVTEQGSQWFKFKAKNRMTDKAEIRFKLSGSRFSKLIYQVIVADFLDTSKPRDDSPSE